MHEERKQRIEEMQKTLDRVEQLKNVNSREVSMKEKNKTKKSNRIFKNRAPKRATQQKQKYVKKDILKDFYVKDPWHGISPLSIGDIAESSLQDSPIPTVKNNPSTFNLLVMSGGVIFLMVALVVIIYYFI